MKKVLMVGPVPPPTGGIASVMEDIIHSTLAEEYEFLVFDSSLPPPAWATGFFTKVLFRMLRVAQLFLMIRRTRPSLVHVQASGSSFFVRGLYFMATRLASAKLFLHLHGTDWDQFYPSRLRRSQFILRHLLQLPDYIVVLYSLWANKLAEIGVKPRVKVLKNFLHDVPPPEPSLIEATRKELGMEPDSFVVLIVGSVGERKGAFDVLQAVPGIVSQENSVRFILVGGEELPGEMDRVLEVVEREGLHQWVSVLGEVDRSKIPLLFGAADIFLLPSHNEGLPISILEALRSGVPVISCPVGGIPDMVEHGVSGLLIPPGEPDVIARAVLSLKKDPSLKEKLAAGGRKRFEDEFEVTKCVNQLRELYERLID